MFLIVWCIRTLAGVTGPTWLEFSRIDVSQIGPRRDRLRQKPNQKPSTYG